MKKYFFIITFLFVINVNNIYADNCQTSSWFALYECNVKETCNIEPYKTNKVVFNTESFKKAEDYENDTSIYDVVYISARNEKPILKAIWVYKENMNGIYKCAMINAQMNSIWLMKQKLLSLDKVWDLKKAVEPKIDSLENKLEMVFSSSKCSNIDKKSIYNKLNILKQTTYETCNYNFYLEYLKDYYKDINNSLWTKNLSDDVKKEVYVAKDVAEAQEDIMDSINEEIEQSYKTFPIAFNAYSEFENNFPMHFLLEILKEDFAIFRDKLYKTLGPINQVVYKIHEAMSNK
jgi:hypothetical protein